jgi:hypothetical protein
MIRRSVRNCVLVPGVEMWRTRICCCSSLPHRDKNYIVGVAQETDIEATNHQVPVAFYPKSQLVSFLWSHGSILCHISHNTYSNTFQGNRSSSYRYYINFVLNVEGLLKIAFASKKRLGILSYIFVHLSAWNNVVPTTLIFVIFYVLAS